MKCLTRSDIKKRDDLPRRQVECPSWGGCVFVRAMTVGEQGVWAKTFRDLAKSEGDGTSLEDAAGIRELIAIAFVVDQEGKNLFTDDDAEWLSQKNVQEFDAIFQAFLDLNGLSEGSEERLAKNSPRGQTTPSSSRSRGRSAKQSGLLKTA